MPFEAKMQLTSTPLRNSSTTTRSALSVPKRASIAAGKSAARSITKTPFPAASPSALSTKGAPTSAQCRSSARHSLKTWWEAVGTPASSIISLAKALELSSRAAALVGPTITLPLASNRSTTPASSATSGPTTVRSIPLSITACSSSLVAVGAIGRSSATSAMPGFPGAQKTFETRGDAAIRQLRACSLAPAPITRTFIPVSFSGESAYRPQKTDSRFWLPLPP